MLDVVTERNAITPLAPAQAAVDDAARQPVQAALATRRLLDALPTPDDSSLWFEQLRAELAAMTPAQRAELIDDLREVARKQAGTDVAIFIEQSLENIEDKGFPRGALDELLELLYSLMSLMARAGILRNKAAAEMAALSVDQARLSGQKGVEGATLGLAAAIIGIGLSTSLSCIALRKSYQVAKCQVGTLKEDARGARSLQQNGTRAGISPDRHGRVDELRDRYDTKAVNPARQENVNRSPSGESMPERPADRATAVQPVPLTGEEGVDKDLRLQRQQQKYSVQQQAAATLGQYGFMSAGVMQSVGGMGGAVKASDAKIADAEGGLAQMRQRDVSQHAQRYDDQKRELFATVRSLQDANVNTASSIAASMRV